MNTIKILIRLSILLGLATIGILLIFAKEQHPTIPGVMLEVIFHKGLGIACFWAWGVLYRRWRSSDRLLRRNEELTADDQYDWWDED